MANYVLAAVYFTLSGTTVTVQKQQNVTSVVRNSTGQFTITFTSTLSTGNYGALVCARRADGASSQGTASGPSRNSSTHNAYSTAALDIIVQGSAGGNVDPDKVAVIIFDPTVANADILAADYFTVSGTTATLVANTGVTSVTRKVAGVYEHDFSPSLSTAFYSAFGGARYGDFTNDDFPINGQNRNSTSGNNLHTTAKFSHATPDLNNAGFFDIAKGCLLVMDPSKTAPGVLARARVSVSGGACSIVNSGAAAVNVSSVTYESTGWYRVNFSSALANANYGVIVQGKWADTSNDDTPTMAPGVGSSSGSNVYSTSAVDVLARSAGTAFDIDTFDILVFDASLIGTASSTTYNVTQSETIALADTVSDQAALQNTVAETVALADTVSSQASLQNTVAEAIALADTPSSQVSFHVSVSEALALADTVQAGAAIFHAAISETLALTDNVSSGQSVFHVSVSEAMSLVDAPHDAAENARITQFGFDSLAKFTVASRITQMGLGALGKNSTVARITQMGLLVLARGGDGPLQPSPLSLHDAGISPVLRQRFVNMYPEQTPQGPAESVRYQRGGLYQIVQYGGGPIQAMEHWTGPIPVDNEFLITISGGNVFRDNTNIGTMDANIDPVWFPQGKRIHAARSETQFMACSNGKLYNISLTNVTQVATADVLPAGIRDIAFLGGRFVYILDDDSGQFYWSSIGDGTVIDGLSFATDAEDDPRALLAVWELSDDLVFMTTDSFEFWFVSADPNNPYQRSLGRRFNKGLLAQDTVELIDNSLFWLGSDRQVYRTGAGPIKVSTFDIDNLIRKLGDEEVKQCYAYGVTFGGHNFYVINLMSQGTWAHDIASKTWAQWKTWDTPDFRVMCTDDTFRVLGDRYNGTLMGMDGGIYTDLGDPMERVVSSYYPWHKGRNNNFNVILHCTRGVGGRVEMRFSDHEGHDWVPWEEVSMGATGDRDEDAKALWMMLGGMSPPGRAYEFRCTDDCFFAPYKLRVDEQWA